MIARLLALVALLLAMPTAAHLTPNSEILVDIGQARAKLTITVPIGELAYAGVMDHRPATLGTYLLNHLAVTGADGRRWQAMILNTTISRDTAPDVIATVMLDPPTGTSPRAFTLRYDAVIDRVPNHFTLVMLKSDFEAGHLSDRPRMLGGLREGATRLNIARGPGSAWRGFVSAVGLGMHHIAEGHDHLLFLIALLLPAPLLASGGHWGRYAGLRHMLVALAKVVTAFTIGHSLTLIGGAFFGWTLPARPVESLIALSILISAAHAWRPIFAAREPLIAGLFGLVHGMAFATLIGRFGLEPMQKAQSILGFNIGIEIVQLCVVAAMAPGLVALARTTHYTAFRRTIAAVAGLAAAVWFVERALGREYGGSAAIDSAMDHAGWLLGAFAVMSVVWLLQERRANKATRSPRTEPSC